MSTRIALPHEPAEARAQTSTGHGKDLTNLDFLRAVAVLSVLISHWFSVAKEGLPIHRFGAFGVGLFFVHTSLVLMWSLARRPSIVDFYIRRAARIYPLAIVVTLFVVLLRIPVSVGHGTGYFTFAHLSGIQIAEHLLLVQNLFSGNQLMYVLWSLPLEVQMYLLLPVLFFFLERNRRTWPLLFVWALTWLVCHQEFTGIDLNLVLAACFFLPGVMAYVGFARMRPRLPAGLFPLALLLVGFLGGWASNWLQAAFPALALGLMLPHFHQMRFIPLTRASWYIARYSFGIYLLHPIALVLGYHLLPHAAPWLQFTVFLTSTASLSLAAFHLIEQPGIRLGGRIAARFAR